MIKPADQLIESVVRGRSPCRVLDENVYSEIDEAFKALARSHQRDLLVSRDSVTVKPTLIKAAEHYLDLLRKA